MNRRILIQAATPTVMLGLFIWVACLIPASAGETAEFRLSRIGEGPFGSPHP